MRKLFLLLAGILFGRTAHAQTFPTAAWATTASPAFQGWNSAGLAALGAYVIDSTQITGMMIVHDGKVVYEYGNVSENSYIASCRKSILALLYGKYVKDGTIRLNETLQQLNAPETKGLLESEKAATVQDVISSRSGIFLPASNPGDLTHLAPPRGSVKPGSLWLYNNWDFNMAGLIFEKKTGKNIYSEVEAQLAGPLHMQDWNRALQVKSGDALLSDIPAYHMWFSARDMARIGLLLLNKGKWRASQVINPDWITEMTAPHTTFEELDKMAPFFKQNGIEYSYGYMWWLIGSRGNKKLHGAYNASGAYGQYLTVYPSINTVLVIKTNDLYERQKGNLDYILQKVTSLYDPNQEIAFKPLLHDLEQDEVARFVSDFKKIIPKKEQKDYRQMLNELGYKYLNKQSFNNALQIFRLNVDLNPREADVFDSYGECYFMAKDYPNALRNYEKALKLTPPANTKEAARLKWIVSRIKGRKSR